MRLVIINNRSLFPSLYLTPFHFLPFSLSLSSSPSLPPLTLFTISLSSSCSLFLPFPSHHYLHPSSLVLSGREKEKEREWIYNFTQNYFLERPREKLQTIYTVRKSILRCHNLLRFIVGTQNLVHWYWRKRKHTGSPIDIKFHVIHNIQRNSMLEKKSLSIEFL